MGRVVAQCWLALARHFGNMTLDRWVLMPDHMHGIIIRESDVLLERPPALALPSNRPNGTRPGSLNAIIQNFKSISTRKANQLQRIVGARLWQRNYYERIIRTERELDWVRRYIDENPAKHRPR
jgi:REP element-mobilizing transposase RayT